MLRPLIAALLLATPLSAHEYWIEPVDFTVATGEVIEAHLRNGENFKGAAFSYLPQRFRRFDVIFGDNVAPVEGRAGDMPAARLQTGAPGGLVSLVHVSTDSFLTYSEWQKFVNFVTHKDAEWVLEEHAARGLGEENVRERYVRYSKSLIAVGEGAGADAARGLEVEIVALANPYVDDVSGGLPVQVLYQGAPRGGAQIELFDRGPEGEVAVTIHRADAEGRVVLPVAAGHEYLADNVVLRALDPAEADGAVWESLWAALTFAVPE